MDTYTNFEEKMGFESLEHSHTKPELINNQPAKNQPEWPSEMTMKWKTMTNLIVEKLEVSGAFIFRLKFPRIEIMAASPETGNPFTSGDWFTLDQQTTKIWVDALTQQNRLILPTEETETIGELDSEEMKFLSLPLFDHDGSLKAMVGVIHHRLPQEMMHLEEELEKYRTILENDLMQGYIE